MRETSMAKDSKDKMNGSVDLLAKAMRQVFTEAVEDAVEPLREDVKDIRENMTTKDDLKAVEGRLDKKIDDGQRTTNENVQAQLAQHRQDIASDVKDALKSS